MSGGDPFEVAWIIGFWVILAAGVLAPFVFRFAGSPLFSKRVEAVEWLGGTVAVAMFWPIILMFGAGLLVIVGIFKGYAHLAAPADE